MRCLESALGLEASVHETHNHKIPSRLTDEETAEAISREGKHQVLRVRHGLPAKPPHPLTALLTCASEEDTYEWL